MRVASINLGDTPTYALVDGDQLYPVPQALRSRYPDLRAALAGDALGAVATAAADSQPVPAADIEFAPVIPNPDKTLCVGINYVTHIREMGREMPAHPWLFVRFAASQTGHGQPLLRPPESPQFDYEGELAVIIGKPAHRVRAAEALRYIAGYSCFNDGSVRDFQRHSSQFTAGKNFLHSGSLGPCLVTADEIPDPGQLSLETRLNGQVMQAAGIDDLLFSVPALLEYITTFTRLEPGDVIATGTPGGVGVARHPPVFMTAGDVVEVEISGIGVLRNPVIDGPPN